MRKKILYIITQSEMGGAQRYLLELVTHLNPNKYNITIAAGPGGAFLDLLKAKKCQIYRLKHLKREIHHPIKDIKAYFELKNLIYTTKPDILQLLSTKAGILGSLAYSHIRKFASHSRNSYVIYRIGGWSFLEDLPSWKKWLYIKLEKWTARHKDKIIVNCEAHRQLAIDLKIAPPEKIITIYNGIDLNKLNFLPREKALEKLLNIKNKETPNKGASFGPLEDRSLCSKPCWQQELLSSYSKKNNLSSSCAVDNSKALVDPTGFAPATPTAKEGYLLYNTTGPKPGLKSLYHEQNKYIIGCIANFYKNKGLEYLIKAVNQLSIINYQLSIIGDGIERDNLKKLIQELGLEKKIILHGQLPNAYQYLRAFDIFVLPSIKEGQPWSILEAMAAELPIISTNIAAIPEMIKNNQSGLLVEPKNSQAIAEKINYLINNPDIAKNFSQKARKIIQKKFTIKKMIEQTEKLYY